MGRGPLAPRPLALPARAGAEGKGQPPATINVFDYTWGTLFEDPDRYLELLRRELQQDRAIQQAGGMPANVRCAKGTPVSVALKGRARPLPGAHANSLPKEGYWYLELSWSAIDRDLWPLGSWDQHYEKGKGPNPRYGKGADGTLLKSAIHHGEHLYSLGREDVALMCRYTHPPANTPQGERASPCCYQAAIRSTSLDAAATP